MRGCRFLRGESIQAIPLAPQRVQGLSFEHLAWSRLQLLQARLTTFLLVATGLTPLEPVLGLDKTGLPCPFC